MKRAFVFLFLFCSIPAGFAQLALNGNGTPGSSPVVAALGTNFFLNTLSALVITNSISGGTYSTNTTNGRVLQALSGTTSTKNLQLIATYAGTAASGARTTTWTSSNTGVATVNAFGYVTQVGNGTVTITAATTTPIFIAPYTFAFATNVTNATNFLNWAVVSPVSLPAHMNSGVDALLSAAGSFSSAKQNIYSATNDTTFVYTRNASVWTGSVDLSGIPASTSNPAPSPAAKGGALITPTDVASAYHFPFNIGQRLYYVDNSNTTYTAAVSATARVGSTDISIAHLNWTGAIPTTLAVYPVLPANYVNYWADHNANLFPVICSNQFRQIFVQTAPSGFPYYTGTAWTGGELQHYPSTESGRSPWTMNIVGGDSGSPVFVLINNQLVLIGCNHGSNVATSLADNISAINSVLATLDAGGTVYTLTTANMSSPITFPNY